MFCLLIMLASRAMAALKLSNKSGFMRSKRGTSSCASELAVHRSNPSVSPSASPSSGVVVDDDDDASSLSA
uniref:Putative secreted protein n=1 Tax=Anopheles darlingi TaxID=43151 RepID=A0A2M4DCD1_ANODA